MGLAAGQARLLTITGRKSDCEFESMRLSHQKIALARELADLSNQYQDSLDVTKLVYDYYGTGDTNTPLSYGILMSPSILNDFIPTTLTDSMNRVVLDSKRASAARAAGIPQEGLGTLPSETVRNNFIQALGQQGIISDYLAQTIMGLPYNQAAGLGGGPTVAITTRDVSYDDFKKLLMDYSASPLTSSYNTDYVRALQLYCDNPDGTQSFYWTGTAQSIGDLEHHYANGGGEIKEEKQVSLYDILSGDYVLMSLTLDEHNFSLGHTGGAIDAITNSAFWDSMFSSVEELLDVGDAYTRSALDYARSQIEYMITFQGTRKDGHGEAGCEGEKWQYNNDADLVNFAYHQGGSWEDGDGWVSHQAFRMAHDADSNFIGQCLHFNCGEGSDNNSDISAVSINLSNVFKAYLTYFADFMNGISKTDSQGIEIYEVNKQRCTSRLVGDEYTFKVKTGSEISSDDYAQATFYDALFNQLCLNGWTENDNVNDNDYVQKMLENGMMYITKMKEDGYYYQGNYATDNYIKVVADERKIAAAEAKYNTEKAKLNAKEQTLDMKMKNLDTEISSLTTEYDTIKNTLSKNIERGFKRYSA